MPHIWMSIAGLALLVIGLVAAKNEIVRARGLNKIVALAHVCFAVPLAVFGAEHFALGKAMIVKLCNGANVQDEHMAQYDAH